MKDYKNLGLKAGIEVHNQLNTQQKLFCSCSTSMLGEEPLAVIVRKQHPVASELGEYDIAAQYEVERDRIFVYEAFKDETCHVELDEEPPHPLNQEALETAITVATLFNCKIPDEIHVMRKTVIDGSNTTSFQRTMVVGLGGFLKYKSKKIPIEQVSLEEDAAAISGEENGIVRYRLNRLGVPLIEVSTGLLENFSPKEIEEVAFNIGMTVRSTGKAKKAIGAIRQDLNVSIKGGARNELKGVQELGLLSKSVENEVDRQLSLIWLAGELNRRGVKKIHDGPVVVNSVLSGTSNKILKSVLERGGNLHAIVLPKFAGLLKKNIFEGKTLGREFADIAVAFGLNGLFHSDEDLSKYRLEEDFEKIRAHLKAGKEDALIVLGEDKTKGRVAKEILDRARSLLRGAQEGTRSVTADGSTKFNRPLPGAKRMYPESDVVPIPISRELIKEIRKNLPEPLESRLAKLEKRYRLSHELAEQILSSDQVEKFETVVKETKAEPRIVANALISVMKDLEKREGIDVSNLGISQLVDIFDSLSEGKIVKESVPDLMKFLAKNPNRAAADAVRELGIRTVARKEIESIVKRAVADSDRLEKAIGIAMSELRGKVEAKTVVDTVKKFWRK